MSDLAAKERAHQAQLQKEFAEAKTMDEMVSLAFADLRWAVENKAYTYKYNPIVDHERKTCCLMGAVRMRRFKEGIPSMSPDLDVRINSETASKLWDLSDWARSHNISRNGKLKNWGE